MIIFTSRMVNEGWHEKYIGIQDNTHLEPMRAEGLKERPTQVEQHHIWYRLGNSSLHNTRTCSPGNGQEPAQLQSVWYLVACHIWTCCA